MLRFERDEKNKKQVLEIEGTRQEIISELCLKVMLIYQAINEDSEVAANAFKNMFKKAIREDLPFMTEDEIDKKVAEAKSVKSELRKQLLEIFDDIFGDDK